MEFTGTVVQKPFAPRSKSAHDAVFLVTSGGEYKLERMEGNPFQDEVLLSLVGREIRCSGVVIDHILRITEWKLIP